MFLAILGNVMLIINIAITPAKRPVSLWAEAKLSQCCPRKKTEEAVPQPHNKIELPVIMNALV